MPSPVCLFLLDPFFSLQALLFLSLLPFLWIVARTCFCIWLFSSALSGFDRRKLTLPEVVLRFGTAFACLALSPAYHLPAIAIGLALIAFDMRGARSTSQFGEDPS